MIRVEVSKLTEYLQKNIAGWGARPAALIRRRYDITFSKNTWQFFVNTRLVANIEPVSIRVIVDGKAFQFDGKSPFNKQSFPMSDKFLAAMKTPGASSSKRLMAAGIGMTLLLKPMVLKPPCAG